MFLSLTASWVRSTNHDELSVLALILERRSPPDSLSQGRSAMRMLHLAEGRVLQKRGYGQSLSSELDGR